MPYVRTFGDVPVGEPLLYLNSLLDLAFAINLGNFAKAHQLEYGGEWTVAVRRAP
jgi:S-adenosylmethionine hydrolase